MNEINFKNKIKELQNVQMTHTEKSSMRIRVARHMHNHPVGSKASLFSFRYALTAVLMMVITIGSGTLITSASQSSLPGDKLYSIKRTTEELKKITLKNPTEKVTYELALIDKRFSEANQLTAKGNLTAKTEVVVIDAIEQHTNDFKTEAKKLAVNDPADALSYSTKLTNTLKTGTHILMALSDQQITTLAKADTVSPNTLVLAAYATAQKVTEEKKQLETIVASDTNIATIKTAEKRYTEILALLAKQNIIPSNAVIDTTATALETAKVLPTTTLEVLPEKTITNMKTTEISKIEPVPLSKKTVEGLPTLHDEKVEITSTAKLQALLDTLQQNYEAKKYGQVIIIADEIEQQLNEKEKIQAAEKTFNVTISTTEPKAPETSIKGATEIAPEVNIDTTIEKTDTVVQVKK